MEASDNQTFFSDMLEDVFIKLIRKDSKDPDVPPKRPKPDLADNFYFVSASNSSKSYPYHWELHGPNIFCKKNESGGYFGYMSIDYAFLKKTSGTMINDQRCFGLLFIKRKTYEQLFSPDEEQIDRWFEKLKQYCILTKFKLSFETKNVLGRGNFAKVFCVQSIETGRQYAVKAFQKAAIMKDPKERKCLQYEIKMLRAMRHDRVVRLEALYEGEHYIYCLLELFKGSNLFKALITKGYQPEAKSLAIIFQILEALEYMHGKKIMHRDLKPENIMLRSASDTIDIGLVDLGFATYESDYKNLFYRCGTPGYVAPEILNDRPYDCKADIFSAGVIFYILLSGVVPFYGKSYEEIVKRNSEAVINFSFPGSGSMREATLDLLRRMLERDPMNRISARDALLHPCFQSLLSRSPLIIKHDYNSSKLLKLHELAEAVKPDQNVFFPDRIEDCSPNPRTPRPVAHPKAPPSHQKSPQRSPQESPKRSPQHQPPQNDPPLHW